MRDPLTYFLSAAARTDQYLIGCSCRSNGRHTQEIRGIKNEPANKLVKAQIAQDEIEALARDAKNSYGAGFFSPLSLTCVVSDIQSVAVFAASQNKFNLGL